jgi:hypothetical protein
MKLSAVVQLMDGFSGQPALGVQTRFTLDERPFEPLEKGQGFYAFADLEDGEHCLKITCRGFLDNETKFSALSFPLKTSLAESIIVCELEPSPAYPYPTGMTLVRGRVLGGAEEGKPLADVIVEGTFADERGKTCHCRTRSYGVGRYALALRGRLPVGAIQVELRFAKEGYTLVTQPVSVPCGTTKVVDINMQ